MISRRRPWEFENVPLPMRHLNFTAYTVYCPLGTAQTTSYHLPIRRGVRQKSKSPTVCIRLNFKLKNKRELRQSLQSLWFENLIFQLEERRGIPGQPTRDENTKMSYWKRTRILTPISWVRTELLKLSISLLQCLTVNCSYRCIHKRPVTVRKAKCWNSHNWWTKSHTKDILSRMSNCTVLS